MKNILKKLLCFLLVLVFAFGCFAENMTEDEVLCEDGVAITADLIVEYGCDYYLKDEVALYLYAFCELPPNYITKNEAMDLGWVSNRGNLWDVFEGGCIGGDRFGNYERILPTKKGRTYYECDVNYEGGYRDVYRIVFSTDGLIYSTEDHYETFELLYEGWFNPLLTYKPYKGDK